MGKCNLEKNIKSETLRSLIAIGAINKKGVIIDDVKFNKRIEQIDLFVKNKYGIIESISAKTENKKGFFINEDLIKHIDQLSKVDFNFNFLNQPNFDKILEVKENLLKIYEGKLSLINSEKKKNLNNYNLSKKLNELESRINFLHESITRSVGRISESTDISDFISFSEIEFDRLSEIINSDNVNDIEEAHIILNMYLAVGTFDGSNPIFGKAKETSDSDKDSLRNLKHKAEELKDKLSEKDEELVMDLINNNDLVQNAGLSFDHEDLFGPMPDISTFDMYAMDITNTIFSDDSVVGGVMKSFLQKLMDTAATYSRNVEERLNEMMPDVHHELGKMGYKRGGLGIVGYSFELFRAVDENGFVQPYFAGRYSTLYNSALKSMKDSFFKNVNSALKSKNVSEGLNKAYGVRNRWLRSNTLTLNPRLLKEVRAAFPEFEKLFEDDNGAHEKELKDLIGSQEGYNDVVNNQIDLIKKYKISLRLKIDSELDKHFLSDYSELPGSSIYNINLWISKNNPFEVSKAVQNGTDIKLGETNINFDTTYIESVPLRKKRSLTLSEKNDSFNVSETDIETNYYDTNFKIIESNKILYDFHKLATDVSSTIYETLPHDKKAFFSPNSMLSQKKGIIEILLDYDIKKLKRLSLAARYLYEKIKNSFSIVAQSNIDSSIKDPITGKVITTPNSSFFVTHSGEILKRYTPIMSRIKLLIGNKDEIVDLSELSQDVIDIIADNLDVRNNINSIQKRFPSINTKAFPIYKILHSAISDEVVRASSMDMPKILKFYTHLTMEYNARVKAKPYLNILKDHYDNIDNLQTTNVGEAKRDINDNLSTSGKRSHAKKRMQSWYNRAALGYFGSKSEFGDLRVKNKKEQDDINWLEKNHQKVRGRITSKSDKLIASDIQKLREDLKAKLEAGDILEDDYKDELIKLSLLDSKLGGQFSLVSAFDNVLSFTRFMGLAWNLAGFIKNFLEGQISNLQLATLGHISFGSLYRANHMMKLLAAKKVLLRSSETSFGKKIGIGNITDGTLKKIEVLMSRFDIMQDATNELQKASIKSSYKGLSALKPFSLITMAEFRNQSPVMIAMLLDQEITDVNGNKSNVFDAMDQHGKLLEAFRTPENIKNWENGLGKTYDIWKTKTNKAIVIGHGDYDNLRGMLATEYTSGKAMTMYRRWLPRQIQLRFGEEQKDIETGIDMKGRFKSHTGASAAFHGALIGTLGLGLLGSGLIGMGISGGIAYFLGSKFGQDKEVSVLKEMLTMAKALTVNVAAIHVNRVVGKEWIKQTDLSALRKNEIDRRNLASNIMEMSILITNFALGMIIWSVSAGLHGPGNDDDDDQKKNDRRIYNILVNKAFALSGELSVFTDPEEMWNLTFGKLPVLSTYKKIDDYIELVDQYSRGEKSKLTADGKNRFTKDFRKFVSPGVLRPVLGFENDAKAIHYEGIFSKIMKDKFKTKKQKVAAIRKEYRNKLTGSGKTKEEINKAVSSKFKYKKKSQSYSELYDDFTKILNDEK